MNTLQVLSLTSIEVKACKRYTHKNDVCFLQYEGKAFNYLRNRVYSNLSSKTCIKKIRCKMKKDFDLYLTLATFRRPAKSQYNCGRLISIEADLTCFQLFIFRSYLKILYICLLKKKG